MDTNAPVERRRPARCGRSGCDGALYDWSTEVRQCAEVLRIEAVRRTLSLTDVFCGDCGARTAASRAGTVRGTSLGPHALALLWVVWSEIHCSAATLDDMARIVLGIRMGGAGAACAINAANDLLGPQADAIRAKMGAVREHGEIDEGCGR